MNVPFPEQSIHNVHYGWMHSTRFSSHFYVLPVPHIHVCSPHIIQFYHKVQYIKNIFSCLLYHIWKGISAVMDYDVGLLLQISSIGCNVIIVVRCRFARCVLVPLVLFSFTCTFLRSDRVQNIQWLLTRTEHIIIIIIIIIITTTTFAVVDESGGGQTVLVPKLNVWRRSKD